MNEVIKDKIEFLRIELNNKKNQLDALNPMKVLNRGYSITTSRDGKLIMNIKDVKEGEEIVTNLKDGTIISAVKEVEAKPNE